MLATRRQEGAPGRVIPVQAQLPLGLFYVLLDSEIDTVPVAREDYDTHVQRGDELYLEPRAMTVRVVRDGAVVALIPTV